MVEVREAAMVLQKIYIEVILHGVYHVTRLPCRPRCLNGLHINVELRESVGEIESEGFFEVAHDLSRPFSVYAGNDVVRAVGTAFSVRLRGDAVERETAPREEKGGRLPWPLA